VAAAEHVRELIEPIIEQNDAELYDLEFESGVLRVAVDREGGIDVDTIGELSRLISDALDRDDPIPDAKYLLEVTSPGVERKLRTPAHFQKQIGETVAVKFRTPIEGQRRLQVKLLLVDEDGIELEHGETTLRAAFTDIESARSVFDWDSLTNDTRDPSSRVPRPKAESESGNQKKEKSDKKKAAS
jgi:ribosome maturation factor RimP